MKRALKTDFEYIYLEDDTQNSEIENYFVADVENSPDEVLFQKERKKRINFLIKHLYPRNEFVIRRRFALGGGEETTLEKIGDDLEVSKERIRQLEAQGLRMLRARCKQLFKDIDSEMLVGLRGY